MVAYVLAEAEHTPDSADPAAARYRSVSAAAVARHGGRYLARGALPAALEGSWPGSRRLVLIEFPTADDARAWYDSPDYRAALAARGALPPRRILIVDGGP